MRPTINIVREAGAHYVHSFYLRNLSGVTGEGHLIQRVLEVPHKRFEHGLVTFLDRAEVEAVLAVPNRSTWLGRRDHALLLLAVQTGLRLSELTGLVRQDIELGTGAHVRCQGKGRKARITPLTKQTVAVLRVWLKELDGRPGDLLFPSRLGGRLSPDALQRLVNKYVEAAAGQVSSLQGKKVTPHVLRHTSAMQLLKSGVDTAVIALWLGHENVCTTQIYLHADFALKERALARTAQPLTRVGRYRPPDPLLAFLESL